MANVYYPHTFKTTDFILRMFTIVYLKINETLKKQIMSKVMSGTRTHPNRNTSDAQAGNLYIASFTQGSVHIKFHYLSLFFSKSSISLIGTQSGKTFYEVPRSATVPSQFHSLMGCRNSPLLCKDLNQIPYRELISMSIGPGIKFIFLILKFLFKECMLQATFTTYISITFSCEIGFIIKSFYTH